MSDDLIIYQYSRARAIEEGVLVDVSKMAKEVGIKYPTAVSAMVMGYIETFPERQGQSVEGRLWDTLCLLKTAAMKESGPEVHFKVLFQQEGGEELVALWGLCGPGDDESPVITVMLEGED